MESKIDAILWKIGSSVVFTVPSKIVKDFGIGREKKMVTLNVAVGNDNIMFIARPWKCGGSYVVTVPTSYVEVYKLNKMVESKAALQSNIKLANAG